VDWGEVARSYGEQFQKSGGEVKVNFEVGVNLNIFIFPQKMFIG
jgi:predicted nucleotidyltransferase